MLTTSFYILLTISIVAKCINCYVVDNALLSTVAQSKTDENRMDYANGSVEPDAVNHHIQKSESNVTTTGEAIVQPSQSNDDVNFDRTRTYHGDSGDTPIEAETGRKKYSKYGKIKYGKYGAGKLGKKKKYRKFLVPVIFGLFFTKMIMFPVIIKVVTILSSAAFVFSKMSLLASLILGLKFFLSHSQPHQDSKVEIVHVPLKKYGAIEWDRDTSESKINNVFADTNVYDRDLRPTPYIL